MNIHNYRRLYLPFFIILFLMSMQYVDAQHDMLLKGGHLIDPKNEINGPMDIAITDGKIAAVASNISPNEAKKIIDVSGLYIAPGLIDMHVHVFMGG